MGAERAVLVRHEGPLDPVVASALIARLVEREKPDLVIIGQAVHRRRPEPDRPVPGRAARLAPGHLRLQVGEPGERGRGEEAAGPHPLRGRQGADRGAGGGRRPLHPRAHASGGGHHRPAPQQAALRLAAGHHEGEEEGAEGARRGRARRRPRAQGGGAQALGAAAARGRREGDRPWTSCGPSSTARRRSSSPHRTFTRARADGAPSHVERPRRRRAAVGPPPQGHPARPRGRAGAGPPHRGQGLPPPPGPRGGRAGRGARRPRRRAPGRRAGAGAPPRREPRAGHRRGRPGRRRRLRVRRCHRLRQGRAPARRLPPGGGHGHRRAGLHRRRGRRRLRPAHVGGQRAGRGGAGHAGEGAHRAPHRVRRPGAGGRPRQRHRR